MNSLTITGNLGKDAEMRSLSNGDPVLTFSVADSQGKEKPAIWWNCSLFGKRGESLSQYLTKGQQVTVVGTVSEREYTDKNGMARKAMDVRVSDVALQGGRRESADPAPAPAPVRKMSSFHPDHPDNRQPAQNKPAPSLADMEDDIPF
jgi:single-strand DNA-binding protein